MQAERDEHHYLERSIDRFKNLSQRTRPLLERTAEACFVGFPGSFVGCSSSLVDAHSSDRVEADTGFQGPQFYGVFTIGRLHKMHASLLCGDFGSLTDDQRRGKLRNSFRSCDEPLFVEHSLEGTRVQLDIPFAP